MKRFSTNTTAMPSGPVGKAFEEVSALLISGRFFVGLALG